MMKLTSKDRYLYLVKRDSKKQIFTKKLARKRRHRKRYKIPKFLYKKCSKKEAIKRSRHKFMKELYKKSKYNCDDIIVKIENEIGIEKKSHIEYFLNIAENILDTNSRHVRFNIEKCPRIWPSAVSMICSLIEWSEVSSLYNGTAKRLRVEANKSEDPRVNEYLNYCGFSNYVEIPPFDEVIAYQDKSSVKIRRELTKSNIEEREDEIVELVQSCCQYNDDEIEMFNSVILTEIFNNVTEHGFSHKDMGWWILAQTHQTNKFVSLCISDNGIGIRNSLVTGPQRKQIKKLIKEKTRNYGELIRLATQENISGAISATIKDDGWINPKYPRGARRGNGLRRIKDKCIALGISLNILSHSAYLMYDSNGIEVACGARKGKVFAGTMYHLVIPMERKYNDAR